MWEVDWSRRTLRDGSRNPYVWARNTESSHRKIRKWHWTTKKAIVNAGILWKPYDHGEWEIDWSKRTSIKGQVRVWARNTNSSQKRAREWHWTSWQTLLKRGVKWEKVRGAPKKIIGSNGYVQICKSLMSESDIELANRLNLWIGNSRGRKHGVKEHQLVAARKYGELPVGFVVRHLNGDKTDNRPENLVLGTRKDNSMDHKTAVIEMMYWRERALVAEGKNPSTELLRRVL